MATLHVSRSRFRPLEAVFWITVFAAWWMLPSHRLLINEIAILGLFALSLDLILGYAGIVSLGHAAFFGFGAYAAGLLSKHFTPDPLTGLLFAASLSALLGLVSSVLVLRGSDLSRLMVTLAFALVMGEFANSWSSVTGGADGLQGITMGKILGKFEFDFRGTVASAYSLMTLFVVFLITRVVVHSPFGLSLQAIRDNPLRAGAIGVPVQARLMSVYALSACIAGVAGALLAQTTSFVSLDVLDFHRSADLMLVVIIGGTGYLYGGLIGAVLFKLLQNGLAQITPQYWQFWIGLFLVAFVLIGRERITGFMPWLFARLRQRS